MTQSRNIIGLKQIMIEIDFHQLPKRERAACINSVTGFKSANLIATVDENKKTNLAIFSSCVHLGSDPALIGFVQRPASVQRHTYENILATEVATLNQVHDGMYIQAHHTAARYPRHISEFTAAGLNHEYLDGFTAPFVKQSRLKLALRFVEDIDIEFNHTVLMVMLVEKIYCSDNVITQDGHIDIQQLSPVVISGLDSYHSVSPLERLPYAKPRPELVESN